MKWLARWAWNGLAAASLVLWAATCVLWVRGYRVEDAFAWRRADAYRVLRSTPGYLIVDENVSDWSAAPPLLGHTTGPPDPVAVAAAGAAGQVLNVGPRDTWADGRRAGFAWFRWRGNGGNSIAMLAVPSWAAAGATAALPLTWCGTRLGRARARRRASRASRCHACGYDLRATPTRCPECGLAATEGRPG